MTISGEAHTSHCTPIASENSGESSCYRPSPVRPNYQRSLGAALTLCFSVLACACDGHQGPGAEKTGAARREARVCAKGPQVPGIDVSSWQGDAIDWDAIAAGGDADFAFIRVMHGLEGDGFRDGPDAHFDRNWAEAKRVGMLRGAYQYFITAEDPIAQADFLITKIGQLEKGDLPPVIDIEVRDGDAIAPVPQIIENIGIWLKRVEAALGVRPIIYTSQSMWERMTENSELFSDYPLWVANFNTECPLTPDAWTTWTFHQHSSTGGIEGYADDIDKNTYAGSLEELVAMADHTSMPEPDAGVAAQDAGGDEQKCQATGCSSSDHGAGSLLLVVIGFLPLAYRRRKRPQV